MFRRSLLAATGAVAAGQLASRSAFAQPTQIKGAGDILMRQVFQAWNEAGSGATGVSMAYDPVGSNEGLAQLVLGPGPLLLVGEPACVSVICCNSLA